MTEVRNRFTIGALVKHLTIFSPVTTKYTFQFQMILCHVLRKLNKVQWIVPSTGNYNAIKKMLKDYHHVHFVYAIFMHAKVFWLMWWKLSQKHAYGTDSFLSIGMIDAHLTYFFLFNSGFEMVNHLNGCFDIGFS